LEQIPFLERLKELLVTGSMTICTPEGVDVQNRPIIQYRTVIQLDADVVTKIRKDVLNKPNSGEDSWRLHCEKIHQISTAIQQLRNALNLLPATSLLTFVVACIGLHKGHIPWFAVFFVISVILFTIRSFAGLFIRYWILRRRFI
jgi:hypothetical protein